MLLLPEVEPSILAITFRFLGFCALMGEEQDVQELLFVAALAAQ